MRRSDFEYSLPEELIAQVPPPERAAGRLLCVEGAGGGLADRQIRELPALLRPLDLLVFNDTRVLPARVHGRKPSGGAVEIMLERALPGHGALVQLRASKPVRPGMEILVGAERLRVQERRADLWVLELPEPAEPFFERHGAVPLPPYIRRAPDASDAGRYQSVFARVPGAVAAPTASLHFDAALLAALAARGVQSARLTLHVGAGTFQPLRTEALEEHHMHAERFEIDAACVAAVRQTRAAGGRVIAVGTTVARALEAAAADGELASASAETALFIRPGYRFRLIDGLLTNFHLSQSTLLMLVSAFGGHDTVMGAYRHAVAARYRFFSYGDAMLVWPAAGVRA